MFSLKYPLAFLGSSPRWDFWLFGCSSWAGGSRGRCEILPLLCQGLAPLLAWDTGSRQGGCGVRHCFSRTRPKLPFPPQFMHPKMSWDINLSSLSHWVTCRWSFSIRFPLQVTQFYQAVLFSSICSQMPQKWWAGCDSHRFLSLFVSRLVFFHITLLFGTSYLFDKKQKENILPKVSLRGVDPPILRALLKEPGHWKKIGVYLIRSGI